MITEILVGANDIVSYILIGVLLVGMIVMMFVQSRRSKKAQDDYVAMLDTLRVGVKVKMASGLLGRIKEIREEAPGFKTIVVSTGDDKNATTMTFMIEAVQGIVNEEAINRMNVEQLAKAVNAQEEGAAVTNEADNVTKVNGEPIDAKADVAPKKSTKTRTKSNW